MIEKLRIKETTKEDLYNVLRLWNDGEVMFHVGFPNGLGVTIEHLIEKWLPGVNVHNKRKHYSIYHDDIGYCGESFYSVDEDGLAALDIKLFPESRGKGIAFEGLKHAIEQAFRVGDANAVYVDPSRKNTKALRLYKKFGFEEQPHPEQEYRESHHYFILRKENHTF